MADFWLVLRAQLAPPGRYLSPKKLRGLVVWVALGAFLTFGALRLFRSLATILADYPEIRLAVEHNLLALWAVFAVVLVLGNAFNSAFTIIYQSEDTSFLLSLPLAPRAVFAARLTWSLAVYLAWTMPFMLGPYIAYGVVNGAGLAYYAAIGATFVGVVSTVVCLAALFITAVMAYVPGARLKQWIMAIGLLVGLVLVLVTQLVTFSIGSPGHETDLLPLLRRLGDLSLGGVPVLPHLWLAQGAQDFLLGRGYAMLTLSLAIPATLYSLTVAFGARVYATGWASGQEAARRPAGRTRRAAADVGPGRSSLATPFWSVMRRELRINLRTPTTWYLFAVGALVAAFPIFNIVRMASYQPVTESVRLLVVGAVLVAATFSGSMFAGSAMSREGSNYGLVRSWPMSPLELFLGKVAAALPLPLALAAAALSGLSLVPALNLQAWRYLPVMLFALPSTFILLVCLDTLLPDFAFDKSLDVGTRYSSRSIVKGIISIYFSMALIALLVYSLNRGGYVGLLVLAGGASWLGIKVGTGRLESMAERSTGRQAAKS